MLITTGKRGFGEQLSLVSERDFPGKNPLEHKKQWKLLTQKLTAQRNLNTSIDNCEE